MEVAKEINNSCCKQAGGVWAGGTSDHEALSMDEGLLHSVVDYNLPFSKNNYVDLMSFWRPLAAPASSHWLYGDKHLEKAVSTTF